MLQSKILYQTIASFHFNIFNIDYWNNRIKTKYDLLNLPKMNSILCLTTTETSEPVANVRSTSRVEAALVWKHERAPADLVDLTSSKSAKHIFK